MRRQLAQQIADDLTELAKVVSQDEATTTANVPYTLAGFEPAVVSRLWARRWKRRKPRPYDDEEDK